jgi:hypothetical protein
MYETIAISWKGKDSTITESGEFFSQGKFCNLDFAYKSWFSVRIQDFVESLDDGVIDSGVIAELCDHLSDQDVEPVQRFPRMGC